MTERAAVAADTEIDIAIIGAGPVALFSVFQLGLFGFKCHLFDARSQAGGQCAAFYPDKPIYDVPGFPILMGDELIARLLQQISPYQPVFHFNHLIENISTTGEGVRLITSDKQVIAAKAAVLATGLGPFGNQDVMVRPDPLAALDVERFGNTVCVNPETFKTSQDCIYAIGDGCHYPGKLKLILSGFHEAALMTQAIRRAVLHSNS